ncbi:MAG: hypothetical protein AB9897_07745 [Anaerolineaceae bacterium]
MKYLRYICLFLIFVVLAGSVQPATAQDYRFQVPDEAAVVTINTDGSISIDYTITFTNDSGAHAIDIVDIGMPNSDYVLKSISGTIGGQNITKITTSDVVNPGISLYLLGNEIPAGGTGTVTVHVGTVKNVIYPGTQTESEPYASLVFAPNYYGSQYVYGNTNLQVTLLLPTGLTTTETRYFTPEGGWPGAVEPESKIMADGKIFFTWVSNQANAYTEYKFGTSFPARVLAADAIVTTPYQPPSSSTGGTSFDIGSLCPWVFCLGFIGFFVLIIYSATIGAKKRKLQYLPPKISMEGHGIKRGLTAVEAGILMEQPMDKIMTMILFGLLKKNAAEVTTKEPLAIKPADPLPADLYGYETDFLAAFSTTSTTEKRKLLQTMMVNLIKSVGEKMKGFSKKETVAFYQDIMRRAWDQVEQAATPEVKGQVYEDQMDWTMLDNNYEKRTTQTFSGPVFIPAPTWWWRYDPSFPRSTNFPASTAGIPSTSGGGKISLPSLPGSAFAASVVGGVQNFSSNVLGNLTSFTGGVTNVTNPPPPPSTYRSSGGSSGGHSCACACACAGCACACAGGGR